VVSGQQIPHTGVWGCVQVQPTIKHAARRSWKYPTRKCGDVFKSSLQASTTTRSFCRIPRTECGDVFKSSLQASTPRDAFRNAPHGSVGICSSPAYKPAHRETLLEIPHTAVWGLFKASLQASTTTRSFCRIPRTGVWGCVQVQPISKHAASDTAVALRVER